MVQGNVKALYFMPVSYAARVTHQAVAGDMTSKERHEARYKRRKAKREVKRQQLLSEHSFEKVTSVESLYQAAHLASRGVSWKASTQRYMMNLLCYIYDTHVKLLNGQDIRKGFNCFDIKERGKLRHIQSVHFSERVVQKSLCKNALIPVLTHSLIYDNGASQEGKGTHFTIRRLQKHLERHYRHHGREGGILLLDFHDYFGQIDHDKLKEIIDKAFDDERLKQLTYLFIDAFDHGLGLGSEVSQVSAVSYPNRIDHFIKEALRIHGYARFMDDSYLIHEDIRYLEKCLEILKKIYKSYGIQLNENKTRICDLKHGFSFMKTRFYITKSGHIVKKPSREAITRQRRKLKKQAGLVNEGRMTFEQVHTSYASWKGSMMYRDAHRTTQEMDKLFNKLFIENWR